MNVTQYLPSVRTIIGTLVVLVIINALLELSGLYSWIYTPVSSWRNRNAA